MKDDLQIIVCPICGATDLEIEKDQSLIKCDYCGTTFMVPQNEVKIVEHKVYVGSSCPSESSHISSKYHEVQDYEKLCTSKMKKAFVEFLPLWICAWLSAIIAYIAFSFDVKYINWENIVYNSYYEATFAMYITSLVAVPVFLVTATTCTVLRAKHLFMTDFCDIKPWKTLSKDERKSANTSWSLGLSVFQNPENHAGFFVLQILCGLASLMPLLFPAMQLANFAL